MAVSPIAAVIIHRHGARLPNVIFPGDLMFPSNPKFWNKYNAALIPMGVKQARRLGKNIRQRYIDIIPTQCIAESVSAVSSNTERSIMSCVSFIDGFAPETPRFVSFEKDYEPESYHLSETYLQQRGKTLGIKIHIECGVECLNSCESSTISLFHRHKSDEIHERWKEYNTRKSPELQAMAETPRYQELMDKLYTITEYAEIAPDKDMLARLINSRIFITHLRIAQCQHSEPLPNTKGIHLTTEDTEMIEEIARVNYEHLFQPYNKLTSQEIGSRCVGDLLREILDFFEQTSPVWRFREYSAHDTTLLAIAAQMGVTIENPNFTGYFLFELYPNGMAIYYNPDPTKYDIKDLKPKSLKRHDVYKRWEDYPDGITDWTTYRTLLLPPDRPKY